MVSDFGRLSVGLGTVLLVHKDLHVRQVGLVAVKPDLIKAHFEPEPAPSAVALAGVFDRLEVAYRLADLQASPLL